VRSRIEQYLSAISRKARRGDYTLQPTLVFPIPKPAGGFRDISVFSVIDAAVGFWLSEKLISRNAHFFSTYSYAYRRDRNAHHALQVLDRAIQSQPRMYVLEFDFAKYFDNLKHDYLLAVLDEHFKVSGPERTLLERFMKNRRAYGIEDFRQGVFEEAIKGIPQGSSVSLFLANVASHELDKAIERTGAVFARYADDTLVICEEYFQADKCARLIQQHGRTSGSGVNFQKSEGISILTEQPSSEFTNTKRWVKFLGHQLGVDGISVSDATIERMKAKASRIIYNNLLLHPERGTQQESRLGPKFRDWDLVNCVNELRGYIYGNVSEAQIETALSGNGPLRKTRCTLSFYPTVDEAGAEKYKGLDGWLVSAVTSAYKKRVSLLRPLGVGRRLSRADVITGEWYQFPRVPNETALPSFYKGWLYVRKTAMSFGLDSFPVPSYGY